MGEQVDLYGSYAQFTGDVLGAVRRATFGVDIGQNSWLTVDEYERLLPGLALSPDAHLLEVACGSGGPAIHVARALGCRVTGLDASAEAVATAVSLATEAGASARVGFEQGDANAALPFADEAFDAVLCIDAMNHLPDRIGVLREWTRVLRPGGRVLFTDPVVVTGPVTSHELALRSSIGQFLFVPPGVNEGLIAAAGLRLLALEDVTDNAARIAGRWHAARQAHREALVAMEGEARFDGLQRFFQVVHDLSRERRLARFAYLAERPA
jgi:SAM-dependent methyltransferase